MADKSETPGSGITYRNSPLSKESVKRYEPANHCIYCTDGVAPFTREHVIPQGMGGGIIYPAASCEKCQKIIKEIETYCMRGPFLSHRLKMDLVQNLDDLGKEISMAFMINGQRVIKKIPVEKFPHYLALPTIQGPARFLTGGPPGRLTVASFGIWGIEEELRELNRQGNALLVDNFDPDKFGRALAKIAHGIVAGELGLENFEPLLPDFILGKAPEKAALLIGNWPEDGMARPPNILHQVGMMFERWEKRDIVSVRIRLFAENDNAPIYRVVAGIITKPINDVLARLGLKAVPPVDRP